MPLLSDSQICEATTAAEVAVEFSTFLHSIDYSPDKINAEVQHIKESKRNWYSKVLLNDASAMIISFLRTLPWLASGRRAAGFAAHKARRL